MSLCTVGSVGSDLSDVGLGHMVTGPWLKTGGVWLRALTEGSYCN